MHSSPIRPLPTFVWLVRCLCAAVLWGAGGLALAQEAAAPPCTEAALCHRAGPFTATVVRVNVSKQDSVTAYQGVRTTVRFTNVSRAPAALAYRDKSSRVTDDQGLAYTWSSKAAGIGLVTRDAADPQFTLQPGESREATFESVLQYSMRRQVAGHTFTHDITIVQLQPRGERQVHEVAEHALSFAGLTATTGYIGARGTGAAPKPAGATEPPPAGAAGPATDACAGQPACQTQGPVMATVVRVNVTDSGGVTAYHVVRTTIRFKNLGSEPLILGYRRNTNRVTDDQGNAYSRFTTTGGDQSHVAGIGIVSNDEADPQFRLAPGESREASFEAALQYSTRRTQPGRRFAQELTLAQLAVAGPRQVRTLHDYVLSFGDLQAQEGGLATIGASGSDAAQALNKAVDLLRGLKK